MIARNPRGRSDARGVYSLVDVHRMNYRVAAKRQSGKAKELALDPAKIAQKRCA